MEYCHFEVWVQKEHAAAFCLTVFRDETDPDEESEVGNRYEDAQAPYAYHDECEAAAKAGLVFAGTARAGDSFGGARFYAKDGEFHVIAAGHDGEGILIEPERDGSFDRAKLEVAFEHHARWIRLHRELSGEPA